MSRRAAPPAFGVKRYVAEVKGAWGLFQVFTTGDDRFYLFSAVDELRCATGLQFPVRKTALRDDVRRALHHGWGHA